MRKENREARKLRDTRVIAGLVGLASEKAGQAKASADNTVSSLHLSLIRVRWRRLIRIRHLLQQLPGNTQQTLGGLLDESRNLVGNILHQASG